MNILTILCFFVALNASANDTTKVKVCDTAAIKFKPDPGFKWVEQEMKYWRYSNKRNRFLNNSNKQNE